MITIDPFSNRCSSLTERLWEYNALYIKLILIILLFFISSPSWAANYYCDSNAAGGGDGSIETPWNTLAAAQTGVTGNKSDSFLYIKRGSLFHGETLVLGAYGTDGHQFTITAYGTGELPKIWGSNSLTSWTNEGSGIWYASHTGDPLSIWFVTNGATYVWGSKRSAKSFDAEYQWYYASNVVYVYTGGDAAEDNPATKYSYVEYPVYAIGMNINDNSYVTVSYLEFSFQGGSGTEIGGVYQYPGPNPGTYGIRIEYCNFKYLGVIVSANPQGQGVYLNNVNNSYIGHNTMDHTGRRILSLFGNNPSRACSNNVIEHNVGSDTSHHGYNFFLQDNSPVPTMDSITVRNNMGYTTGKHNEGWPQGATGLGMGMFQAESNNSYGGRITNLKIYNNIFLNAYDASSILIGGCTAPQIYNNAIYSASANSSSGITINNRAYASSSVSMKNNIAYISGSNGALNVTITGQVSECENNLWYAPGNNYVVYTGVGSYDSAQQAAYKLATGWDDNGLWEDPKFVNAGGTTAADYKLASNSPCIGVGANLSGTIDIDYFGTARPQGTAYDVGAYEYFQVGSIIGVIRGGSIK